MGQDLVSRIVGFLLPKPFLDPEPRGDLDPGPLEQLGRASTLSMGIIEFSGAQLLNGHAISHSPIRERTSSKGRSIRCRTPAATLP